MTFYVTCRVGTEWYGIPIDNVLEVLHLVALNQAPQSDKVGMMTLRERVVPVMDLRQYMCNEDYTYDLDTPIVAVQQGDHALGLIVDETDDVVELDTTNTEPYSDDAIKTVLRSGERMIFILDVNHLFERQIPEQI